MASVFRRLFICRATSIYIVIATGQICSCVELSFFQKKNRFIVPPCVKSVKTRKVFRFKNTLLFDICVSTSALSCRFRYIIVKRSSVRVSLTQRPRVEFPRRPLSASAIQKDTMNRRTLVHFITGPFCATFSHATNGRCSHEQLITVLVYFLHISKAQLTAGPSGRQTMTSSRLQTCRHCP